MGFGIGDVLQYKYKARNRDDTHTVTVSKESLLFTIFRVLSPDISCIYFHKPAVIHEIHKIYIPLNFYIYGIRNMGA